MKNTRFKGIYIYISLLVPVILILLITLFWREKGHYKIDGDEPHYLLIADSLIRDKDLWLINNYQEETSVSKAYGSKLVYAELGSRLSIHLVNGYSIHSVGLPVVLMIPYWIKGVIAAKLFIAFINGITISYLFYYISRKIISVDHWAALLTVVFAGGLPFLAAGNQIYPDLISGVLILSVLVLLFNAFETRNITTTMCLFIGSAVSFLPWLHLKLLLPGSFLIGSALMFLFVIKRYLSKSLFYKCITLFCLLPILSILFLAIYNYKAFQNILGPYQGDALTFDPMKVTMIFLGLLWDSRQGIFIQQPLLFLGLIGVVPLAKSKPYHTVMILLLFFSLNIINAMHTNWYGGYSFWGRFGWSSSVLWIFPLAYAVKEFLLLGKRIFLLLLFLIGLSIQNLYAVNWVIHNRFLYNNFGDTIEQWSSLDLISSTFNFNVHKTLYLPFFYNFNEYYRHWPNLVIIVISLVLIFGGFLFNLSVVRKYFRLFFLLIIFILLGISAFLYNPSRELKPLIFEASSLPGQVGIIDGTHRLAKEGEIGYLIYGPYLHLRPNTNYRIKLSYEMDPFTLAEWDVAIGNQVVLRGELPSSNGSQRDFEVYLNTEGIDKIREDTLFEFRVYYHGQGNICITSLEIVPIISDKQISF